jgi:hypothetical protein
VSHRDQSWKQAIESGGGGGGSDGGRSAPRAGSKDFVIGSCFFFALKSLHI